MEEPVMPCALVVDDDLVILLDVRKILEGAGFRVYEAGNGDEVKELVDAHSEDMALLFSDVSMPGRMDGLALARYVAERWPAIEIVIASGRGRPEPGDLPDRAAFIAKPFSARMIHNHLRATFPDRDNHGSFEQLVWRNRYVA